MTICSLINDHSQVSQHWGPKFTKSFTLRHNAPFHSTFPNDISLQQKKVKFSQGLLAGNKAHKTGISWISASTFYFVFLYSLSSCGSQNCTTSGHDAFPKPATSPHALACVSTFLVPALCSPS